MSAAQMLGDILLTTARYRGYRADRVGPCINTDAVHFEVDGKPVFITGIEACGSSDELISLVERKLAEFPSRRGG